MKKRIISLLLIIVISLSMLPLTITVSATTSGTCGQQISWTLDDMGTLTLTGQGPMDDYGLFGPTWQGSYTYSLQDQPWKNVRDQIKTIVISEGITYIGDTAFASCKNLVSVNLPNSLSRIGDAAFATCPLLEEIVLPNGVESVELLAFFASGLKSVSIPLSLKSISQSAFSCESITTVYYSGSEVQWKNISIADSNWPLVNADIVFGKDDQVDTSIVASGNCGDNVTWIFTSDGVLTISGYGSMEGWGNYKKIPWYDYAEQIFTVNIKEGVTRVAQCSFAGCSYIESVSLPDTITQISSGSFSACKRLKDITIPEGVKSIGDGAFGSCYALTTVTIPASVTSISIGAFENCDNLTDIYYCRSESAWNNIKIYRDNECLTEANIHFNSQSSVSVNSDLSIGNNEETTKRLTKVNITYSDGTTGSTKFTYNDQGLIIATNMVSPYFAEGQETVYTYDLAKRLTAVQVNSDAWYAIGPKAEYIYDNNGFLVKSSQAEGSRVTQLYENDSNGRRIRSSSDGEGVSYASEYSYNIDATQMDEIQTKTDYEGNVTTDYITYYYDELGNITKEVCSGTYWSYTRQYAYNYKPFVAVSENNQTPYRIYLPDIMGNPIWEIEYMMVATMQNDTDGYLSRIITDSGDTYDFIYEEIEASTAEDIPKSELASNYHFKLYSPNQELTVEKGKYMQIICALYDGDQRVEDWEQPTIAVGNTDIISYTACKKVDNGYCITVDGHKEGTASLSLYDSNTEASLVVLMNVIDEYSPVYSYVLNNVPEAYPESFWDREVKTNFYNFNGLYVTGIDNTIQPQNGVYHLNFNVYNTKYMHGSVDVYNAEGRWIKSVCIEKNAGIRNPWDAIEDGFYALCDIIEWNGSYTTSYTSQETAVSIDVPEGGYFVITNNFTKSPAVFLYNSLDFVIWAANKTIDAGIKTEAIKDVQDKVIEDILLDPEYIDMAFDMVLKTAAGIAADASGNTLKINVIDTAGNIASQTVDILKELDIDISKIFGSVTGTAGNILVKLLPKEVQTAYAALFSVSENTDLVGQVHNIMSSANHAYIRIFTPQENSKMTVEGVTVIDANNSLPENALLQVTRIPTNEVFAVTEMGVETEEYQLYDINYSSDGVEVQPNGNITVQFPIPTNYDWEQFAVLHQQHNGSWEVVESRVEHNMIVAEVDHFSLFAVVNASIIQKGNGSNLLLVIGGGVALIIVTACIFIILYNKKQRRRRYNGRFLKR